MKNLLLFLVVMMLVCAKFSTAQQVIQYDSIAGSPNAKIEQVNWIEGHWRGEAFGGSIEEIWSPPHAGTMMFSFRLVANNKLEFYEFGTISEEENTLVLRLRHFHSDLKGWEEKGDPLEFRLVRLEKEKVYFEGFTFEKINNNEINIYVLIHSEGKETEVKFNYHRFLP